MSQTATEPRQSKGSALAQQSFDSQVRFWRSRCQATAQIVDSTLESISEHGSEIFSQDDGYPELPLVAIYITSCLLGFTPEKVIESEVMTEALFERLSSVAPQMRELAGSAR